MTNTELFLAGFDKLVADFADGITWEAAFDLATTPADNRPACYTDGALAAKNAFEGWLDCARRLAKHHKIPTDIIEARIAATRLT